MKEQFFIVSVLATIGCFLLLVITQIGFAQVRSSTNYQLQSDSINFGGGLSSSTNYVQESTFGEVGTGPATSTSYNLYAGYQQMQEVYLSMTAPENVVMSPDLPGITGGTSNGSTTVIVTTDSPAGYSLTIEAENSPAMQRDGGGESIADYNDGSSITDNFVVGAGEAKFGFTPDGDDVTDVFLYSTLAPNTCGTGFGDSSSPDFCWSGLTTTGTIIAEGSGSNHPAGATTSVYFRVGVGSNAGVIAGVYTATTTLTALPL